MEEEPARRSSAEEVVDRCQKKNPTALLRSGNGAYGWSPVVFWKCRQSAHSFHEVQLEYTRWQASWLMADSDVPPPSHPPAAGSGLLFTSGTCPGGRLTNYSGGTAPDSHRISFSARCTLRNVGATDGTPAGDCEGSVVNGGRLAGRGGRCQTLGIHVRASKLTVV